MKPTLIVKKQDSYWSIQTDTLELHIHRQTGCICETLTTTGNRKTWSPYHGDVTVRDDLLGRTFARRHLKSLRYESTDDSLKIIKTFHGAPWKLQEIYHEDHGDLCWEATVNLEEGDYRSCAVTWQLPWPQPIFPIHFWAPKAGMPSQPSRFAGIDLEYGEITSGITMPLLAVYRLDTNAGLALAMPFDFQTPRFRFISEFREQNLKVEFDWLALSPKHEAKAKLMLTGTAGDWRPALGWVYHRYQNYFHPRSTSIQNLWGGHVCGKYSLRENDASTMAQLGIKWYEIHGHFPAYGNYHPEGMTGWKSGHFKHDETVISESMIHETISTLHKYHIAAFPYLQVSGDGDQELLAPEMTESRVTNRQGENWEPWPGTFMMNSSLKLPFGKDISRQIDGLIHRYPEIDGVFLDQAGYNFVDTAHADGITAIDNQPAYMIGFNYLPHLEHLSKYLHPDKAIIANGPFGVTIIECLDGFMAEGSSFLCEQLQYYTLGGKPLFFLMYAYDEAHIEVMFQKALLYGAGFASYPEAMPAKYLFEQYQPILQKLYRRTWVFEPNPLQLPVGFLGNIYRSERGTILVTIVQTMSRTQDRQSDAEAVTVTMSECTQTKQCMLYQPGKKNTELTYEKEDNKLHFKIPVTMTAGLVEIMA